MIRLYTFSYWSPNNSNPPIPTVYMYFLFFSSRRAPKYCRAPSGLASSFTTALELLLVRWRSQLGISYQDLHCGNIDCCLSFESLWYHPRSSFWFDWIIRWPSDCGNVSHLCVSAVPKSCGSKWNSWRVGLINKIIIFYTILPQLITI